MNREEFCRLHWNYYLMLETDFIDIERYISFDLGDNYLYDMAPVKDYANSRTFSNEFVKQYQTICSEVDVILKSICRELENKIVESMPEYTEVVFNHWSNIFNQKVKIGDGELQPFRNWSQKPSYKAPDWWKSYNSVKHARLENSQEANLKNVVNALAGLYILELYLVKFIGDRDDTIDVPNGKSRLFELVNFTTRYKVIGRDLLEISTKEIDEMFSS